MFLLLAALALAVFALWLVWVSLKVTFRLGRVAFQEPAWGLPLFTAWLIALGYLGLRGPAGRCLCSRRQLRDKVSLAVAQYRQVPSRTLRNLNSSRSPTPTASACSCGTHRTWMTV